MRRFVDDDRMARGKHSDFVLLPGAHQFQTEKISRPISQHVTLEVDETGICNLYSQKKSQAEIRDARPFKCEQKRRLRVRAPFSRRHCCQGLSLLGLLATAHNGGTGKASAEEREREGLRDWIGKLRRISELPIQNIVIFPARACP